MTANKGWRIVIIIVIILILLAFGTYGVLVTMMRQGLISGWKAVAADHKIDFPEQKFNDDLKKVNFTDLNKLVKFSKSLDANNYTDALLQWKDVKPVLQKAGMYDDLKKILGINF